MALTFTTGMTSIDNANTTNDWSTYKITSGGATPSIVQSTDIVKEGSACNCIKPTASKDVGLSFDYYTANSSATLNLTTAGNEVIGVWIQVTSKATLATWANGGIYIGVTSANAVPSSSNAWSKWYVGGSDQYVGGWVYYQVDTRKTASATNSGGATLSTIYQIFFGTLASGTVPRAESFYVDASWYGRPIYTLKGDGTTVADWADFLSDSDTNVNGLIQDVNGAYELSCGIQFGDDAQTATTTFTDATGQAVNFKRHVYYSGGTADALTYSDYYKIIGEGAASYLTSITIGSLVGSDAGILGGIIKSIDPTNVPVIVDFDTDQAHISALNLYGVIWVDVTGSFKLGANSAFNIFSNQFIGCGQVEPVGACEVRNSFFIDTDDASGSLLWNDNIDIEDSQFISNTTGPAIEHASIESVYAGNCTNTGSETTTLQDSGGGFNANVTVGDYVYNETDGSYAQITVKDSDTQLTHTALSGGTNDYWTNNDAYSISPAQTYTNLVFSGNTTDVDNNATGNDGLFVSKAGTSDPATSQGNVVFIGSVTVQVTVKDTDGVAIAGAQTAVYKTSDRTPIVNEDTSAGGVASDSYSGATPVEVEVRVRKSSPYGPKYKHYSSIQNISASGLTLDVTLQRDTNVNLTTTTSTTSTTTTP